MNSKIKEYKYSHMSTDNSKYSFDFYTLNGNNIEEDTIAITMEKSQLEDIIYTVIGHIENKNRRG